MAAQNPTQIQYGSAVTTALNVLFAVKKFEVLLYKTGIPVLDTMWLITPAMFPLRPNNGQITYQGIRGSNQVTDLTMTRVFCLNCREPAGWRVLKQNHSHPTINVGKFLLPLPAPPPPQP